MDTDKLFKEIISGFRLDYDQAVELVNTTPKEQLYALAHALRQHYNANKIDTCSIMNARSGRCSEDCKWCSQSKFHDSKVDIYPLVGKEAALKDAMHNAAKGVNRFSLVTSGRTLSDGETDKVCDIYSTIKKDVKIHLCASLGLLTKEQLQKLKDSGVEHYHCNIETAPSYFPTLCSTHTVDEKLQTIQWAKEVGLKICSGGIIGMGETQNQRIEMAVKLQQIGAVSIPVNILNPIQGTALYGKTQPLTDDQVLTTMAIMRIVNPEANIRLAGGRNIIKHLEQKALNCGVSASIVGDMLTTSGSAIDTDMELFKKWGFEV